MAEIFAQWLAMVNKATYVHAEERFVSVQRSEGAFGPIFANREGKSKFVSQITSDYNSAETVVIKYANAENLIYAPKFF